jgi:predicted kinase
MKSINQIIKEAINNVISTNDRYAKPAFEMLIGIPGSGKSTYLTKIPRNNVSIVCPDDIRRKRTGSVSKQYDNEKVWEEARNKIKESISQGYYTILDATNVNTKARRDMLSMIRSEFPGIDTYARIFDADPEVSKQRIKNDLENKVDRSEVPDFVVDRMYKQYLDTLNNINSEGFTKIFKQ